MDKRAQKKQILDKPTFVGLSMYYSPKIDV